METLYGHQDAICGIDAGARQRCVTVGGRDGSARVWRIVEESQLNTSELAAWAIHKKKPLTSVSH